ncbi:MAG: FAD-dependent monooxygenase [Myxococcota bacterium]|nr:FAD-dependent monooxygenase [Myxococcota bacterium]
MAKIILRNIDAPMECAAEPEETLRRSAAKKLSISSEAISNLSVFQRALDVRRNNPRFTYAVIFETEADIAQKLVEQKKAEWAPEPNPRNWKIPKTLSQARPIIVGAGPAGLFAAYILAEAGLKPIILERGKMVEERSRDVSSLYSRGTLQTDSNVCFGEGGAGTYSDGKLYTRVSDPRVRAFYEILIKLGAKSDILINTRPHIGTDKLVNILKRLRKYLESLGTSILFNKKLVDFELDGTRVKTLRTEDGETFEVSQLILATGHSANDVWHILAKHNISMEARSFAVGFRLEHPQPLINEIRYGRHATHPELPAADYVLRYNQKGSDERGAYSFCMCPGGVVVPTPTKPEQLCINGMSHAARSGRFANSALVATLTPKDFETFGHLGIFSGVDFQTQLERDAFRAGGADFRAPAGRLTDFLDGKLSRDLPKTSYRRGLTPYPIHELFPQVLVQCLREALKTFEKKMPGFITAEASLIGVETRTASPIRVLRDRETHQALALENLYPSGEGMGFGGGIASAALDGIRTAEKILLRLGAQLTP